MECIAGTGCLLHVEGVLHAGHKKLDLHRCNARHVLGSLHG